MISIAAPPAWIRRHSLSVDKLEMASKGDPSLLAPWHSDKGMIMLPFGFSNTRAMGSRSVMSSDHDSLQQNAWFSW